MASLPGERVSRLLLQEFAVALLGTAQAALDAFELWNQGAIGLRTTGNPGTEVFDITDLGALWKRLQAAGGELTRDEFKELVERQGIDAFRETEIHIADWFSDVVVGRDRLRALAERGLAGLISVELDRKPEVWVLELLTLADETVDVVKLAGLVPPTIDPRGSEVPGPSGAPLKSDWDRVKRIPALARRLLQARERIQNQLRVQAADSGEALVPDISSRPANVGPIAKGEPMGDLPAAGPFLTFPPVPERAGKLLELLDEYRVTGLHVPELGRSPPPIVEERIVDVWDENEGALLEQWEMVSFEDFFPAANYRFIRITERGRAYLAYAASRVAGLGDKVLGGGKSSSDLDRKFMERAVEEAQKSRTEDDRVHPKVGVVIVKDGKELARAYRGELDSGEHAEFTALERKLADVEIAGATVYTTLEPCTTRNHPKLPCALRLIERKVRRVVIGMLDPNPKVSGFRKLREANIDVDVFAPDLMSKIEEMNREFIRHHANAATATLVGHTEAAKKAAAAEFLRFAAGNWNLRFAKGGEPTPGERCRIDAAGGYYLLDRLPGQLWCMIEDVQYDAATRNATFVKVKMRGRHWRHRETIVLLPDGHRMEGHNDRGQSLVYERLVADGLRCSGDPVSARDKVFISYSHKDSKFLAELLAHLKPLERAGRVTHWSDRQIQPGSKWFDQIKTALASSKAAVLLVTKDFRNRSRVWKVILED